MSQEAHCHFEPGQPLTGTETVEGNREQRNEVAQLRYSDRAAFHVASDRYIAVTHLLQGQFLPVKKKLICLCYFLILDFNMREFVCQFLISCAVVSFMQ